MAVLGFQVLLSEALHAGACEVRCGVVQRSHAVWDINAWLNTDKWSTKQGMSSRLQVTAGALHPPTLSGKLPLVLAIMRMIATAADRT